MASAALDSIGEIGGWMGNCIAIGWPFGNQIASD
jgi:hypothetical protein